MVGRSDRILSDEDRAAFPPEDPRGVPFADADVTDESFADRARQSEPEVWERPVREGDDDRIVAADEELDTIVETGTDSGRFSEPEQ